MNKADLVARVAKDAGLTKAEVSRVVDGVIDTISRSLKRGDKVTLVGFGTFLVGRRRARAGHNPHTGESMRIPARRMPRFAAGKELKKLIR